MKERDGIMRCIKHDERRFISMYTKVLIISLVTRYYLKKNVTVNYTDMRKKANSLLYATFENIELGRK